MSLTTSPHGSPTCARRSPRRPAARWWWRPSDPAPAPGPGRRARCSRTGSSTSPTGCAARSGTGRGFANVVARSRDGVLSRLSRRSAKDEFDAESLERPALVVTADGTWRAYISAATPGTKHWRVDLIEAATPEGLARATPRTVLPGDGRWRSRTRSSCSTTAAGTCGRRCHPLDDPEATDRMTSEYATSADGVALDLARHRAARAGRRVGRTGRAGPSVRLDGDRTIAYYDGRATAEENWEERTGVARIADLGTFEAIGDAPVGSSPYGLAGCATSALSGCPTATPGSTTRSPVPTAPTSSPHALPPTQPRSPTPSLPTSRPLG